MNGFSPDPHPWAFWIVLAVIFGLLRAIWEALLAPPWWERRRYK